MKGRRVVWAFRIVLFVLIAVAGFGQAVHQLWNWLMPGIFGLHAITFWQSVGLLALSWTLFGGWRGFHGPGRGRRNHWRRSSEQWNRMTPEEREKVRAFGEKLSAARCSQ